MATADDASVAEHRRLFTESMLTKLGDMKDQTERSQFRSEEKFGGPQLGTPGALVCRLAMLVCK